MSYFHAHRRRQIISLLLTSLIICLVLVVRLIPQPWRGIIDLGVVAGLTWEVLSLAVCVWKSCGKISRFSLLLDSEGPGFFQRLEIGHDASKRDGTVIRVRIHC